MHLIVAESGYHPHWTQDSLLSHMGSSIKRKISPTLMFIAEIAIIGNSLIRLVRHVFM